MVGTVKKCIKILFKKAVRIDRTTLEELQNVVVEDTYFKLDYRNYQRFIIAVDWLNLFVHPAYLQMASLPMQLSLLLDRRSPFNLLGLVHIHNEIIQQPNLIKGQPMSLCCRFGRVFSHSKGVAFEVVTQAYQKEKRVYQATATYLDRRVKTADGILASPDHLPLINDDENRSRRTLNNLYFDRSVGRRYAGISSDYNPIHLSAVSAKLFGFKRAIAHGMFSMACAVSKEEEVLDFKAPDEPVIIKSDFFKPILLPANVKVQSGPYKMDRLIILQPELQTANPYLIVQYYRGQASRLHRHI